MDFIRVAVIPATADEKVDSQVLPTLSELELAIVGGGIGDTVLR